MSAHRLIDADVAAMRRIIERARAAVLDGATPGKHWLLVDLAHSIDTMPRTLRRKLGLPMPEPLPCCYVDSTDSKQPVLRCRECGAAAVLDLPARSQDVGAVMRAFDHIHRQCKRAYERRRA